MSSNWSIVTIIPKTPNVMEEKIVSNVLFKKDISKPLSSRLDQYIEEKINDLSTSLINVLEILGYIYL